MICALPRSATAAAGDDPTRPILGAGGAPAPTLHGELQLSLADAIGMGIENNLGVEIQRHTPLIAHGDHQAAWGGFDPVLGAEFGYADIEDPTANILAGAGSLISVTESETTAGRVGVAGLVPWLGARYEIFLTGQETETTFAIQALSPEQRSELNIALTLPLMRDLIWNEPWTRVKTTQVLELTAFEQFRQAIMDTVQNIEGSYWALVADDERVRVANKSLETARALHEQVETQYEVGVVSKVEIAEAQAGEAAREFDLIVAENTYRTTMDTLIDLVLGPNLTADSRIQIRPTDRPTEYTRYDIDPERATRIALENRPEIAIAANEIERQEINLKFAKNQRLPRFDATVAYGNRGISGSGNPNCNIPGGGGPCSVPDVGDFDDTFSTPGDFLSGQAAQQFTARGVISIPFPNTTARANVSNAELQLRRARVQGRRAEQDVILQVRSAARNITSAQRGIEAARRRVEAAEEQLRAERIRLEYGESTPFDVLEREEDLVSAESQEIGAFQTYRTAVTGLDRAQGTILRNRNIQIDQVARLR